MVCAAHGQACGLLGVGQGENRRLCTLRQQRVDGDGALTELSAEHQHLGTLGLELLQGVQTAGQACALGRDRDQHAAVLHGLLIGRGTHHPQGCIGDGLLCGAVRFGGGTLARRVVRVRGLFVRFLCRLLARLRGNIVFVYRLLFLIAAGAGTGLVARTCTHSPKAWPRAGLPTSFVTVFCVPSTESYVAV